MAATVEKLKEQLATLDGSSPAGRRQKIDALVTLARELRLSNPVAGMAYSRQAYELATAAGYQAGIINSLLLKGILHYLQGNYRAALSLLFRVGPLAQGEGKPQTVAETLLTIARVYNLLGDSVAALEYALAAIEKCRAADYPEGEAEAHNMLGIIRSRLNDHQQELAEFQTALQIYRAIGDAAGEATILNDIAMAHMALEEYEDALASGDECLALARQHHLPMLEANVWCTLGEIRLATGDDQAALADFQRSVEMSRRLGFRYVEMYGLMTAGQVHLRSAELAAARSSLQQALAIAEEMGTKAELANCHRLLTEVYKGRGEFETALHHHQQFHAVHQAVFNEAADRKTRHLQILHDTETAQQAAEIFRLKNAELEKEIADGKRQEQQRLAIAMEREKSRILTQFIEDALHEFRTPLSVIKLNLYLLEMNADQPKKQAFLDKITAQTASIQALVEALATMARMDGPHALVRQATRLDQLVRGIIAARQAALAEDGLVASVTGADDLPHIEGDGEKLMLALGAILDNAIQHTPAGGRIMVCTRREDGYLVTEIRDTGAGISAEDLPHIFKRFWRKDQARTRRGFGLGLSIAKRIIELHGGQIEVASTPGEGSTFRVRLPVKAAEGPARPGENGGPAG